MRLVVAAAVLAGFAACSDSTSPTTPATPATPTPPPPTPPPATIVLSGEMALEAPRPDRGTYAGWDFTTPRAGTLLVSVGYQRDDSKILVWVTERTCNRYQFERDECFYLAKSLAGPRPRTLTIPGVAAGAYSLYVSNDGPNDETITYEVRLSSGASASSR
jgi:hypothetical protein